MPLVTTDAFTVDYAEAGTGPIVALIHGSVNSNRQWRALTADLANDFHVVAPNLFGYGETSPWHAERPQRLADHVALVEAVLGDVSGPVHVVGHSFGGSVALEFARTHPELVDRLVLLEPNPFSLLDKEGRVEAFREVDALHHDVRRLGRAGDWYALGERFADYFNGDGTWAFMPEKVRVAFASQLPPNFHEWDLMDESTTMEDWAAVTADTLVVRFGGTRRALSEIFDLFAERCPHWSFAETPDGGHMAPLWQPEVVNPIVTEFLRRQLAQQR